ncbi:Uncharacterized [Moorella glycerini]|uniref:Uncharacterized protein n=1 Tax=Neomoorella stamsii TaxID=1266720 RepID=A0A9X7J1J5_9FIRM|nr:MULTISPECIES: hypothetical protein [Moorella]PRR69577.1 hypothetical protein MOST_29990 [Moorella stamsii]CEP67899.1 Uncharacterized [Moorella glycerini]CEP68769.1 Uncharacterized [Moorella glycerini]
MKIKVEREEKRKHGNKEVKVTVVERELTKEEQIEARFASLEARVAALEKAVMKPKV